MSGVMNVVVGGGERQGGERRTITKMLNELMNITLASYQEMNRNRMRTKMRGETNKSQTRQRPQGGLKMRPMRVKVRK